GVHDRRLVAFSLEGTAELPPQPPPEIPEPIESDFEVDAEQVPAGALYYGLRCGVCHGPAAVSGGLAPDLRASRVVSSLERFAGVVRDGERSDDGMPMYADITYDELVALQHY
ncbi:MAG: PQQ-dependent dehydrogenase, methanol/ethanol family, partial [Gemmatimonadetes bacterium]|nr:PQQ-dependent dehydrogenase, methanol/ethanol family [Gemmatimonadota bacterium]NIR36355.1 PQQ-dependent dehydrogenase, methanol/ethanol family [Actinomycetota bacterium]NIU74151.1 PQQ-dependent dehydrogenase, methanol/ethanol family [Gammaproteobacteria bacterium]NIQ53970.1 PQQ-dependent dehydrogenase, methanol/ethanol family [Gemmatimonadota bacterium]NIV55374.1 PQQ-dependent dehydrogenase, methanol/ethanol family [Actinomycetota bacterium]